MKKKLSKILIYTLFLFFIYYLFTHQSHIQANILHSFDLFITKVFPSLFPMFIITDVLISLNLPYYLNKLTSKITEFLFHINGSSTYVFIMSLLSGTPTNAIIIENLLKKQYLSLTTATNLLSFTVFNNPLFLYNMLTMTFSPSLSILIIINNYLANFILGIFLRNQNTSSNPHLIYQSNSLTSSIIKSISKSLSTLTMIFGTIVFFNLIPLPQNNSILELICSCFLEITTGLNKLSSISLALPFKIIIASLTISFSGLCIQMQIKSVIADTKIPYSKYLQNRLIHLIFVFFLSLLTIFFTQISCICKF